MRRPANRVGRRQIQTYQCHFSHPYASGTLTHIDTYGHIQTHTDTSSTSQRQDYSDRGRIFDALRPKNYGYHQNAIFSASLRMTIGSGPNSAPVLNPRAAIVLIALLSLEFGAALWLVVALRQEPARRKSL